MMLLHIGQNKVAENIQNAWAKTIEDGFHTADIYTEGVSRQQVSTKAFAEAVKANLSKVPTQLPVTTYKASGPMILPQVVRVETVKELKGIDVFVDRSGKNPDVLATLLQEIENVNLTIKMITNRGVKVWPNGFDETFCTDH